MKALFLGSGYTGHYFRFLYPYSVHSFRKKEYVLKNGGGILFDSNKPETWQNLRKLDPDGIIISFPLDECNLSLELWNILLGLSDKILIIGSTSGFRKDLPEITDDSPIDTENKRSNAEEFYRQKGASVIHSAGIYGEGRTPIDWLRKGLIKNSSGTVNLLHGEDLARACSFILENFNQGERYVLSDNHPRKWTEIINFAVRKKYITDLKISTAVSGDQTQRTVRPEKLFEMGFILRHPSLFEEIQRLESQN